MLQRGGEGRVIPGATVRVARSLYRREASLDGGLLTEADEGGGGLVGGCGS